MSDKNSVAGFCACILLVPAIIMFACSWDSLEFTEFGLDYNGIQKTVSSDVYASGRFLLGLGHHFIVFPETLQTIDFSGSSVTSGSLSSRTSDGLLVTLDISFQYKLIPLEIYTLYTEYATDYEEVYIRAARDILTDGASNFTAYQFFKDRTTIGTHFEQELNDFFSSSLHATIEFFQLRDVDLPDSFEAAIQDAEVARQSIEKAEYAKQTAQVAANTRVLQAEFSANVTLLEANAKAVAVMLNNAAEVKSFNLSQTMAATAYAALTAKVGMDTPQLLDYMKVKAIEAHDSDKLIVALDNPASL